MKQNTNPRSGSNIKVMSKYSKVNHQISLQVEVKYPKKQSTCRHVFTLLINSILSLSFL